MEKVSEKNRHITNPRAMSYVLVGWYFVGYILGMLCAGLTNSFEVFGFVVFAFLIIAMFFEPFRCSLAANLLSISFAFMIFTFMSVGSFIFSLGLLSYYFIVVCFPILSCLSVFAKLMMSERDQKIWYFFDLAIFCPAQCVIHYYCIYGLLKAI